jgi:hypothetical protein
MGDGRKGTIKTTEIPKRQTMQQITYREISRKRRKPKINGFTSINTALASFGGNRKEIKPYS